ncbi:phosphoenolpyruvate carboxylase [Balneolaceae bacterium YR4-1]|uniref:Phosphoenolpyruvate carboxylase n=1 Tax=Halalkalibaculum roseum TaxID=2709311 RepID=A0A6M1T148_9BACT|nr:phosphoenolpyruvate carboxylase [Halalkalibaculum roseum]NGP75805.1 phosphoenolpyruvate carboxylase [Halalkalibaculum roseum]
MKEEVIAYFENKSGISENLGSKIKSLSQFLENVITEKENEDLFREMASLPELAADAFDEESESSFQELQKKIREYDTAEIIKFLKYNTAFFHLVNSLEQHEITRINRQRAFDTSPENPRSESIAEAIFGLKEAGYDYEEALEIIGKLDIQPTITAHPTEARRHSVLVKQQHITSMISQLEDESFTPEERDNMVVEILNEINLLLATDEVRTEKVTVEDEVENGMFYFMNSIWETIPVLYEDLRHAFETYYGKSPELPIVLRYRSWIGSDRDGNPNVTEEVTWNTIMEQRQSILGLYLDELDELRRYLSISQNQFEISEELEESIQKDERIVPLSVRYNRLYSQEPYRRKISHIMQKLRMQLEAIEEGDNNRVIQKSGDYTAEDFQKDLELIKVSLEENGLEKVAHEGKVNDLIIRAKTFGFHMAALDIRQHSRLHEETIAELLDLAEVSENYADLPEEEKVQLLTKELSNPRPLCPIRSNISEESAKIMGVFRLIGDLLELDANSFGSYIISMTHGVSDMLEVLILAKEAGLWSLTDGVVKSSINVVPLFETIEDLEVCNELMKQIFENDLYARQIEARDSFQEIMLGYSDSNKDGGYWMANWALEKAQQKLGAVCREYEIDFRLFHGRGGTVGRGGGRSNQAILALPPISNNGRIRFTEQGEVISFRYSLSAITRRHLEQIVNAMIRVTVSEEKGRAEKEQLVKFMDDMANDSMNAYRTLIDDEEFWPWYTTITPIEHISRLPIASRPVSRSGADAADFENLRAIPWVFAWTQVRYNVPGWFGIGNVLKELVENEEQTMEKLQEWYDDWIFFKTILDNAQREMARTHLQTAEVYDISENDKFEEQITGDFNKARDAILKISGQSEILENSPVILKSIRFRNPFTYPLNMMQVELLKRWRKDKDNEELRDALFLSINGIAAAMQSTG